MDPQDYYLWAMSNELATRAAEFINYSNELLRQMGNKNLDPASLARRSKLQSKIDEKEAKLKVYMKNVNEIEQKYYESDNKTK